MHLSSATLKLITAALLAAGVLASAALPANAALFRRDSDGRLLINPLLCQTDYQIRQSIAAQGFTNIALNAPIESNVRVRGTLKGTVYLIDYNYCEARIISATPLRAAK